MRSGIKNFKEFHKLGDWENYITTYMMNTIQQDSNTEIKIVTGRGETIAVWQKHGYGYIEECRSSNRLEAECSI
ncbi:MAG: hypothetical protein GY829_01195 [Gammaproteobacteria bacterium]|nr:hypothetical protein [Gammaproteobacteria bacterium]